MDSPIQPGDDLRDAVNIEKCFQSWIDFQPVQLYTVAQAFFTEFHLQQPAKPMKPLSPLRNPIRSSLSIQLSALILLATFIPIGIGALLFHNFIIKGIAKSVEVQTLSTTSLIEDALQHAFVQNDWEVIQKLVFDIGTQHRVEAIRLLGSDRSCPRQLDPGRNRRAAGPAAILPGLRTGGSPNGSGEQCAADHQEQSRASGRLRND